MPNDRALSTLRYAGSPRSRGSMAACAACVVTLVGPIAGAAAAPETVIETDPVHEVTTVPAVTPIRIRHDLDDLAVRPDGTIVVATSANSTSTNKPARPAASVARFSPLGVPLPSLTLLAPARRARTTQAAVTQSGAVVAWASRGKAPVANVSEVSDDGVTTPPQRLSALGRLGSPLEAASGGGAVGVLYVEGAPDGRSISLRLAYRAPTATVFSTVAVPVRRYLRDVYQFRLAIGAAGDGAILAWSNERHAASLWRIGRDGGVGREIPVGLASRGYVDGTLAVGADGTIGATLGVTGVRASDQVMIAQVPPGTSTLAPVFRIRGSRGWSLETQGVGLAVNPTGRLLVSVADSGGSQVIVEGSGRAFTKTLVPYVYGGPALAAWMPDGSAVVVLESNDPAAYPEAVRLFSIRHAPGAAFDAPRPIGPHLTAGSTSSSFLSLVPAADGTAVLAWEADDGRRDQVSVARITP